MGDTDNSTKKVKKVRKFGTEEEEILFAILKGVLAGDEQDKIVTNVTYIKNRYANKKTGDENAKN